MGMDVPSTRHYGRARYSASSMLSWIILSMTVTPWSDLVAGRPRPNQPADRADLPAWALNPFPSSIDGVDVDVFAIGAFAAAVGKSSRTIRRWERDGVLPRGTLRVDHPDPRARQRRYAFEWIQGIADIAEAEGVLGSKVADFSRSRFTERTFLLRRQLAALGHYI